MKLQRNACGMTISVISLCLSFCLQAIGSVIGESAPAGLFLRMCSIMYEPQHVWFWAWSSLDSCWERLNLKDNLCVSVMCDVFSPSVDWWRLYSVFYPHTFITVFYRCCQPFPAPALQAVCVRERWEGETWGEGVPRRVRWCHFTQQRVSWLWYSTVRRIMTLRCLK